MESKFILRRRKSIFPHQKYRLSFWTVGIFLCAKIGKFRKRLVDFTFSLFPHSLLFPFETCRFRESVIVNTHRKRILQRHRNARQMHGAEKNLDRLRQHREEKPHMIRPPTVWAGFCGSAPLTLPVRSGARPAPAATDRPRACQSNRRTPSARRARTATGTHLPTPAAAQNTPRIAASAFLPSGRKFIMHLDNFRS